MTHTPGPWRLDVDNGIFRVKSGAVWVAFVESERPAFDGHLIAAAPRLLAALETISDTTRMEAASAGQLAALLIEIGDTAVAAIREAKGESK